MARILSAEDKEMIIRRARRGESYASLAREFGVTRQAIRYHARAFVGPRPNRRVTEEMRVEMARLWGAGATAQEIGARFGLGERTVAFHMAEKTGRNGRMNRTPNFFPPVDPADLAYLAAMVDAEGCISRHNARVPYWRVSITGCSQELMDWLLQWGGRIYEPRRQPRTGSKHGLRRQVYVWTLTAAWDIATMLETLLPFMIEKQGRAAVATEDIVQRHGSPPWAPEIRPVAT